MSERDRQRRWRKRHPATVREYNQRSYWRNREKRLNYKRARQSERNAREQASEAHRLKDLNRKHLRRAAGPGISGAEWDAIKRAHGYKCVYCGRQVTLTMDHIIPVIKGGLHVAANIVPACRSCNSAKGAKCGY